MSADEKKNDVYHDESVQPSNAFKVEGMTPNQILDAYRASVTEHNTTIRRSIRNGWKAIGWMSVIGLISIVDRLNETLLFGFQAMPAFQKEFGAVVTSQSALQYTLTAEQQELLNNLPGVGHMIGLAIYGYTTDKIGNRYSLMGSLIITVFLVFITFFAKNFGMVLAGTTLNNIILAQVSAVAPAWCLEIAPLALRPYALLYMSLVQGVASLCSAVMCQHYSTNLTPWAWRLPYAIQWGFPVPVIIAIWFAPESPWWLVRHGKDEAALKSLARLHNGENDDDEILALIQHTVQLERALDVGGTYLDCFKGVNLRRTEVSFMSSLAQNFSGFALMGSVYFFETAGLDASSAFALNCGQTGLSIIGTMVAALLIRRMGRRGLWIGGTGALALWLAIIGSLALLPNQTPAVVWPQGVMMVIWSFTNTVSVGALAAVLTTEIGSVALRRKTQAIGLLGYDASALVSGAIAPYLLNPNNANLKGKAAWIPCGLNILLLIYGYFRIPETQGRNSEELDILFEKKVPARKFKSYKIDRVQEYDLKEVQRQVGLDEDVELERQPTMATLV